MTTKKRWDTEIAWRFPCGRPSVADETRTYYLLGSIQLSGKPPEEWRKLTVKVSRKGLSVRTRWRYRPRVAAILEGQKH